MERLRGMKVFHVSYGHLSLTSFPSSIPRFRIKNLVIWHTIISLALWIMWKARCDYVFNNVHIHLNTMLIELWMLFVHKLHCKVWMMFYGNVKWPLRIEGNDFTYFRIQLLVWSGIIPYLLLCWIVDITVLLISYMPSFVWLDVLAFVSYHKKRDEMSPFVFAM